MKRLSLAVLSLLALGAFSSGLRAQKATLSVTQTAKTTTVKIHYKPYFNLLKLPDYVILGFGTKQGTTRHQFKSITFLTDLVFDIDHALILPAGKLDERGDLVYTLPLGNKGLVTYPFYVQANVLHFTLTLFPKKGFIGRFLKTNLVKFLIGLGR